MKSIRKKRRPCCLLLVLCICIVGQIPIYPALANDRSAAIIGSSPLLTPGIITPTGLSGQGQIVGIADSGLDKGSMSDIHPDLQTESGAKPKVILRSYTDRESADDPIGHGTFMAATIAGTGKASEGKYKGIAPGARIYFQALLGKNNNLKVPAKIDDLFSPAYAAGVRIHVDGWGGGSNSYGSNTADIDKFVYYHPDFLPVFGAGNSGPGSGTLTSQADSKNALVVGSSQVPRPAFDPESNYADQAAASSSLGPTGDGRIKPDLLAPGSSLLSACSSLVESNFTADSAYTRMGGSSMAAAVTGGALALLREQLNSQFKLAGPSSALLKALLINGARSIEGNISRQGYGILDSAGTALSLKEGTVQFNDNRERLKAGESRQYKFQVSDPSMPVKITLAWTDPPGSSTAASALVNNLDLVVQAPGGKIYYGNDFNSEGKVDILNNVEQVSLKVPQAGEYTVIVSAGNINNSGLGQDFALVYGQILKTGVVQEASGNKLLLTDGTTIDTGSIDVQQVVDGILTKAEVQAGSDVYLKSGKAYIFGETWHTGGIQALSTDSGDMLLEMNNQARDGGYYLDERAAAISGSITVNGKSVVNISNIPVGSELSASLNPVLQTLWKLEATNREIKGTIAEVDPIKREFKLLGDSATYKMAPWGALSYQDKIVDCILQDTPFGAAEQNDFASLMPGSKVTLQVSSQSGVVQLMLLERPIAIGRARGVFVSEGKIELDTGKTYSLFPGTSIIRNGENARLSDVQVGDRLMALLLPDSNTIIQLRAYSEVVYGRVVYYNPIMHSLYIIDANNRSYTYTIDKQTGIYGWGIPLESNSIASGSWVRVIGNPAANNTAQRVDVAEIGQESTKTLAAINYQTGTLTMTDNSTFKYNYFTRISKGGYIINPEDILIGEKITLTTLLAPSSSVQPLVDADVNLPLNTEKPNLQVTARSLNGALIVEGTTSASCVYLYRQDGSRERIAVTKGSFTRLLKMDENETELTVVALDTSSGAIQNKDVKISAIPNRTEPAIFNDIAGHWTEKYIVDLARKNVIKGYDDGSFRPDQAISRAELMVIIAQLLNLEATVSPHEPYFTDYQEIPWWALPAVMAAREKGIVYGYPDGSFNPYGTVTRSELAIIYSHLTKQGLTNLFPGETLQPDRPITRAEAAAILSRI